MRNIHHPWQIDASCLPSGNDRQPWVILVLGEPSPEALASLWQSSHLTSSLLIIAAARKYSPPANLTPSVAVLRLLAPLISSEAQTSTRLVNTLQWAHKVAQHWRASPSAQPQFREYEEEGASASYLTTNKPNNLFSWFNGGNTNNNYSSNSAGTATANSSMTELGLVTPPPTRSTSRISLPKKSPDSSTSISSLPSLSVPAINDSKYAFDAVFNFLPAFDGPDATLLKFSILVTTISRPFITCTLPTFHPPLVSKPSRLFSLRPDDLPPPLPSPIQPPPPAHIVHVVPASRSSLILPLEAFCLSFANPSQPLPIFSAPSRIDVGKPGPTPRPFILPPIVLGEVLPISLKWTITELILCGALDGSSLRSDLSNRAWLASSNEIHVIGGSRAFQKSAVKPNLGTMAYRPSLLRNHAYSSHAEEDENDDDDDGTCHHNQWPTPPSSSSSSPTPSVAASVSADPATTTTTKDFGPSSTGMLTPPESDTSDTSHTVTKRKGVLKWIRRR